MSVMSLLSDALVQKGLRVEPLDEPAVGGGLLVDVGGVQIRVQLDRRALVTEDVARRLLVEASPDAVVLVVADRVTDGARRILTAQRGGYLDLRGRLALRAPGVVIEIDVDPVVARPGRTTALAGKAGIEIAAALLQEPDRSATVRQLAREIGRSPSTVSEVLAGLRDGGLTDARNVVVGTDLFWLLADRWPTPRTFLLEPPQFGDTALSRPLRLGLDDVEHEIGWALTDTAAAAAYGAPVAARSDQPLDFLVPDLATVQRARTLLGPAASPREARASVRVAPASAAVRHRIELDAGASRWPLVHPLFVALDLAQDAGRGREILNAWTPDGRWTRVW